MGSSLSPDSESLFSARLQILGTNEDMVTGSVRERIRHGYLSLNGQGLGREPKRLEHAGSGGQRMVKEALNDGKGD